MTFSNLIWGQLPWKQNRISMHLTMHFAESHTFLYNFWWNEDIQRGHPVQGWDLLPNLWDLANESLIRQPGWSHDAWVLKGQNKTLNTTKLWELRVLIQNNSLLKASDHYRLWQQCRKQEIYGLGRAHLQKWMPENGAQLHLKPHTWVKLAPRGKLILPIKNWEKRHSDVKVEGIVPPSWRKIPTTIQRPK